LPDAKKGERLIVLHRKTEKDITEIRKTLSQAGLPNLYIPAQDSFLEIDEIPMLGTGKLDLTGAKQIAADKIAADKVAAGAE
jgi:acyl-[acyl-carrier-protein]-phospholipid O-acyltransferase/long-chain-fatty-acid--[acyl-carrier-protein] ligase